MAPGLSPTPKDATGLSIAEEAPCNMIANWLFRFASFVQGVFRFGDSRQDEVSRLIAAPSVAKRHSCG
jgi:hypothetical protein